AARGRPPGRDGGCGGELRSGGSGGQHSGTPGGRRYGRRRSPGPTGAVPEPGGEGPDAGTAGVSAGDNRRLPGRRGGGGLLLRAGTVFRRGRRQPPVAIPHREPGPFPGADRQPVRQGPARLRGRRARASAEGSPARSGLTTIPGITPGSPLPPFWGFLDKFLLRRALAKLPLGHQQQMLAPLLGRELLGPFLLRLGQADLEGIAIDLIDAVLLFVFIPALGNVHIHLGRLLGGVELEGAFFLIVAHLEGVRVALDDKRNVVEKG